MKEQKPIKCPFCGCNAYAHKVETHNPHNPVMWKTVCYGCVAATTMFFSKQESVLAWNRRQPDARLEKLLSYLKHQAQLDLSEHDYKWNCDHERIKEARELLKEIGGD